MEIQKRQEKKIREVQELTQTSSTFQEKGSFNCVKCHRNYEDENWENGVGKKQIIIYFQEHISKRAASLNLEYAQNDTQILLKMQVSELSLQVLILQMWNWVSGDSEAGASWILIGEMLL